MNKLAMAAAAAAVLTASVAQAATQGTRGPTSTGDIGVTLDIGDNVIVTNLDDVDLGTYVGVDISVSETFCIGQNNPFNVDVTISSANAGGVAEWELLGGTSGVRLPYTLTWLNVATPEAFSENVASNVAMNNVQDLNCGGDNNTLAVDVLALDVGAAPQDSYGDLLTILVAPN